MIALCPTCHACAHRGSLRFDDVRLYRWKAIRRTGTPHHAHLYVEPGPEAELLLGGLAIKADAELSAWELTTRSRLSFALRDEEFYDLNLTMTASTGLEVVRVVDGHVVWTPQGDVKYDVLPGRVRVLYPSDSPLVPRWALSTLRMHHADLGGDGMIKCLDIDVIEPGVVQVEGLWVDVDRVTYVSADRGVPGVV